MEFSSQASRSRKLPGNRGRGRKSPAPAILPLPTEEELNAVFAACAGRQPEPCGHLAALLDRFRSMVVESLVRDRGLRWHDAEDATGSAIAKTYEELLAGQCKPPLRTWYLKLRFRARTFAFMIHRRLAREERLTVEVRRSAEAPPSYDPTLLVEFIDFITVFARDLTPKQRGILWAWIQQAGAPEIALVMKMSRGAVYTAISRLRRLLAAKFPDFACKVRSPKCA